MTTQVEVDLPAVVDRTGLATPAAAARALRRISSQSPRAGTVLSLIEGISERTDDPVYADNRVELLIDGPSTYRAMLKAIRGARRHVHLETYIFASDDVGREFAAALSERSRAGVAVRVLYDAFGCIDSTAAFFAELRTAGVEVREYHGLDVSDPGCVTLLNTRDHRKLLVVDGCVAFTGGINVSREYSSASVLPRKRSKRKSRGWRDTHVMIRGPAVAGFQRRFVSHWHKQGGETAGTPDLYPPPEGRGDDLVQIVDAHGGDGQFSAIYHSYLHAMELAAERIWITQAYLAPDTRFVDTLRAAAQRRVDVRIVVPGVTDVGLVLHASRSRYGALLRAGVRLYETRATVLHAKTAVIDGIWSTVGSSNLDYRSFLHNDEINAIVLGRRFAALLERQFLADVNETRPVLLREWRRRPLRDRAIEAVSRLVDYWL